MKQTSSEAAGWIFDAAAVEALLRELEFRADVIDYVLQVARQIAQSDGAPQFLEFCRCWPETLSQFPAGVLPPQWQVLAAVSAFPAAMEKHRARGVPQAITHATLLDLQRRMDENQARYGQWEFNSLSWMRNHVGGRFFEIGRLQYILAPFGYAFRVYRDLATNAVTTLALPGVQCTPEGWRCDGATGFTTVLEEREDGIIGHPVSADDGSIASAPIKIAPGSPVLLDEHSDIVQIHIPWGGKLERESCVASLQEAKNFFEKYFPEMKVRAFCTATWLLDRELGKVLPATSNIVAFGRLFRPLAVRDANDSQLLERVFGRGANWGNCRATNSLQRAVLHHHHNGGQFRGTAGFILPADIAALQTNPL